MTKFMKINGEQFEVIRSKHTLTLIKETEKYAGKTLWNWYEKPSEIKESIYVEWFNWYKSADNVLSFGVCSASSQLFSISAILYDENLTNPIGAIRITKCHNRVYLMK